MSRSSPVKALVLGSEGNIGAPLAAHLRSVGYDVLGIDLRPGWREDYLTADITHPVDLLPAFDWGPDVVFLLASTVGRMVCEQAGSLAVTTNVTGVNNVLQLCKRSNAKCVFFSSSEVYGPNCDPMDEERSLPQPNNRYALTKWMGEQLVEYEARTSGLKAMILRPCMVYDENETVGEHRSAMIRFVSNLARGRPIEVHRGSARSWLHISDAVRAVEAASRVPEYTVVNMGHPDLVTMADLAELIRVELNASPELVVTTELPPKMTLIKRPTLERQRLLLGVEPHVGIVEGVRRVCAAHLGFRSTRLEPRSGPALRSGTIQMVSTPVRSPE
ncbi:MAG: NAD(P)-dependent oxidoreductase [Gemmatimonadetes bacterium]|nr:NAD(P)-dependent oxidoreductase [Gemmatimonadota bacterium]